MDWSRFTTLQARDAEEDRKTRRGEQWRQRSTRAGHGSSLKILLGKSLVGALGPKQSKCLFQTPIQLAPRKCKNFPLCIHLPPIQKSYTVA